MRILLAAVLVMGFAAAAGADDLTSAVGTEEGDQSPILCSVPCRAGDIHENEPNCYNGYKDITNGGCNSSGWTNLYATGPDKIAHACGTSGTYSIWPNLIGNPQQWRDTDWFRTFADHSGLASVTVTAEFAPLVLLIYPASGPISCSNYTYCYTYGVACNTSSAVAMVQGGTEFWPFVAPQVFGWGFVPCGSRYILDVTNAAPRDPAAASDVAGAASTGASWGTVKTLFR